MNFHVCPICGLQNECMVEEQATNCWCMTVIVPKALLAQLADKDLNARCICKKCIEQHEKKN